MGNFLRRKATLCVGLAALTVASFSGCSPASPASEVDSGAKKVITFDGGEVTEGQVIEEVERLNAATSAQTGQGARDVEPGSPEFEAAKRQVIPRLLAFGLAEAYAEENGIEVSEAEVQAEIDTVQEEVAAQAAAAGEEGEPEELFQQALDQFGYTPAAFREEVKTSLLVDAVREDALGDIAPTEEEVQDFYDQNRDTQFTIPEQRCLRHILFSPDDEETAEEVQQELEDGGDFAALAEEYSQDPVSGQEGGDLGCQAQGAFVPEFDEAAFDAEEGEIVGPVETDFGFHLIEVQDIQEETETPFEEAAPEIEERLSQERQATEFDAWIRDQLAERNVAYLPGYDPNEPVLPGPQGAVPEGAIPEGAPPEGAPEGAPPEGTPPEEEEAIEDGDAPAEEPSEEGGAPKEEPGQ